MEKCIRVMLDFGDKDIETYYCNKYTQSEESKYLVLHTLSDEIVGINLEAIKWFKIATVTRPNKSAIQVDGMQ